MRNTDADMNVTNMAEKLIATIAMIAQLTECPVRQPLVQCPVYMMRLLRRPQYIYDNDDRSPKCPYQLEECDRYITENWYRVVNYHGALEMPTSHVDINSCGANYPGWLNGIDGICPPSTLTEATRQQGETTRPEHENGNTNHTCVDSPVPSEANFKKGGTGTVAVLMAGLGMLKAWL